LDIKEISVFSRHETYIFGLRRHVLVCRQAPLATALNRGLRAPPMVAESAVISILILLQRRVPIGPCPGLKTSKKARR